MKKSSHSEYHRLERVYLKKAMAAMVNEAKINGEWESLNWLSKPDFSQAEREYMTFEELLKSNGTAVDYFPEEASLSMDSIYCRDASIATHYGMIICNMGKVLRMAEPKVQQAIFEANGIPILGVIEAPGTLEGGDVAWLDENTLAVGHSYRSNTEGIAQLKQLLEPHGIQVIVANLPHYRGPSDVFHLMSVLSPVDKDLAVVYSPLLPINFRQELIERGFELVEVADDEFESMGCNVLALAPRKCLLVKGNPKIEAALRKAGCEVLTYNGEEISVKGGGGPTCLTRPITRRF